MTILHQRRSIRLKSYDYTQPGAYFVTIGTLHHKCLFGEIVDGAMHVNQIGQTAQQCWLAIPAHFPHITLDEFVIMPNHLHGVLVLDVEAQHAAPLQQTPRLVTPGSLSAIVRSFKAAATARINQYRGTPDLPVWQRNYYEHVIRNEAELDRIRRYIAENPARWADDPENPRGRVVGAQHAAPLR